MAQLDILPGRRMRWREKSEKDEFGSREERHRLGRFVLRYCKSYLPVRVWVAKMTKKRRFAFTPVLVNGHAKNVLLCYKKFMVCMKLDDCAYWLQSYITINKLYEQKRFQYFVWMCILRILVFIRLCVLCFFKKQYVFNVVSKPHRGVLSPYIRNASKRSNLYFVVENKRDTCLQCHAVSY